MAVMGGGRWGVVVFMDGTFVADRSGCRRTPIAIGFASKEASLARPPGWEPDSWGYHGDDGHCFAAQNVGKRYDKPFGSGDVVGCLINFRLGHALFTRNGQELRMSTSPDIIPPFSCHSGCFISPHTSLPALTALPPCASEPGNTADRFLQQSLLGISSSRMSRASCIPSSA